MGRLGRVSEQGKLAAEAACWLLSLSLSLEVLAMASFMPISPQVGQNEQQVGAPGAQLGFLLSRGPRGSCQQSVGRQR